MEGLLKSRLIRFHTEPVKCEDLYPHVSSELELALFEKTVPDCPCHSIHTVVAKDIEIAIYEIVIPIFNNERSISDVIDEVIKKYGTAGIYYLSLMDFIDLTQHEACYPHLIELNIPTDKFLRGKYWNQIQSHLTDLITKYPDAWNKYGKDAWGDLVVDIFVLLKTTSFPMDFINLLANTYGFSTVPEVIEEYGDCFRVGLLTNLELSDALGLPIPPLNNEREYCDRIIGAIDNPKVIIEFVREWNKSELHRFQIAVSIACGCDPEVVNTENLLGDPIIDYPPRQIYRWYTSNGKIYQFTMAELWDIAEKQVNPYTQETIKFNEVVPLLLERKTHYITGTISDILRNLKSPPNLA